MNPWPMTARGWRDWAAYRARLAAGPAAESFYGDLVEPMSPEEEEAAAVMATAPAQSLLF